MEDWAVELRQGTTLYFASAFRPGNVSDMFDLWVTTRTKLNHDGMTTMTMNRDPRRENHRRR